MTEPRTYRKKPVKITASPWNESGDHSKVDYYRYPPIDPVTGEISGRDDAILMGNMRHCDVPKKFRRDECTHLMNDHGYIDTLEGGHTVCPGDYIIRGVAGEFYPCKPDIFHRTYERTYEETPND